MAFDLQRELARLRVAFYTLAQMRRIDRDYPHPEGSIEAGWYWRERPGAPVGPFKSEAAAWRNARTFLKRFEK